MELEGPGCSDEDCTVFYHAPKARVLRNSVDQFALERTKVPMPDASPFACSRPGCDACYRSSRSSSPSAVLDLYFVHKARAARSVTKIDGTRSRRPWQLRRWRWPRADGGGHADGGGYSRHHESLRRGRSTASSTTPAAVRALTGTSLRRGAAAKV